LNLDCPFIELNLGIMIDSETDAAAVELCADSSVELVRDNIYDNTQHSRFIIISLGFECFDHPNTIIEAPVILSQFPLLLKKTFVV
jgi:hypothetical protein